MDLTKEHFQLAEQNGISKKNVLQRYWDYGWEIERAITEPIKQVDKSVWLLWKEAAQANRVSGQLYNMRLKKGMTPEQAATTPVLNRKGGVSMSEQTHLNAVGEITEMIYKGTHGKDE